MGAPKGPRPITRAERLARQIAADATALAELLKSRHAGSDTPDSRPAKKARR